MTEDEIRTKFRALPIGLRAAMGDFRSVCERCYAMRPDGDEARHWSEFKGSDGHFHIVCPDCEPVMECQHEHTDYQAAEPDVGIMHEYLVCEDCGEDLTDTVLRDRRELAAEHHAERLGRL